MSEVEEWLAEIETETTEVEVKDKTIVITDPCYVSDAECEEWKYRYSPYIVKDTKYGDWSCYVYKGTKEEIEKVKEEWNDFYIPWWNKWNFQDLTDEEKEQLDKEFEQKTKEYKDNYTYGSFCADAGMVAVYDAANLPKDVIENLKEHYWCACFIENYTGPIKYVVEEHVDEDGEKYVSAHIVGDGFYSAQSGF